MLKSGVTVLIETHLPLRAAAAALVLALLACRPVIAIGWGELLILFLLVVFLAGPFLLRIWRAWDAIRGAQNDKEKKTPKK